MEYYFAYGSNMDANQMRERCPDSILEGAVCLPGYRLDFTIFSPKRLCGCADIVPSKNDFVYGLLYTITENDLRLLDKFEGHPNYYRRIRVQVTGTGKHINAWTYEVVNKQSNLSPSEHYLGLMIGAAVKNKFPDNYKAFLSSIRIV